MISLPTGYEVLAIGAFTSGAGLPSVLAYRADGSADIYRTDGAGHLTVHRHVHFGAGWTHLLRGRFGGPVAADLLFYNAASGAVRLWTTDHDGHINRLHDGDIGPGWTHLDHGRFGPPADRNTVIAYNDGSGQASFFVLDRHGALTGRDSPGWRSGWRQIVVGRFDADLAHSDVVLQDASGYTQAYATDEEMTLTLLGDTTLPPATHLVGGNLGGDSFTDLLRYDAGRGELTVHTFDRSGHWATIAGPRALPTGFSHVATGRLAHLDRHVAALFYNAEDGTAGIWSPARPDAFLA